jgi:hypothetical protein
VKHILKIHIALMESKQNKKTLHVIHAQDDVPFFIGTDASCVVMPLIRNHRDFSVQLLDIIMSSQNNNQDQQNRLEEIKKIISQTKPQNIFNLPNIESAMLESAASLMQMLHGTHPMLHTTYLENQGVKDKFIEFCKDETLKEIHQQLQYT